MKIYAIVFPGQGSQHVGMGKTLYDSYDAARRTFEEANEVLRLDISRLSFFGPQSELDMTENTQPALLASGVAAFRVLMEKRVPGPALFAGHSLGEYTALVAAGALEFRDALRLVKLRGRFMQEAVKAGDGKMCAILGLDLVTVEDICERASSGPSVVVPANINTPEQIVVSGEAAAVERAEILAGEAGAKRVVPLQVSAPSHSPLMSGASVRLREELSKVKFSPFKVPVVTNVEAEPLSDPARLVDLLTRQLTSPVRWVDVIRRIRNEGVAAVIEAGPGKVLTGLVRRIERDMATVNLSEAKDIDAAVSAIDA